MPPPRSTALDASAVRIEPAHRGDVLELIRETYGHAMSAAGFDWRAERNPAGRAIVNVAVDGDGVALGALAMAPSRMSQGLAAFAVHAVTAPVARGRGIFSMPELYKHDYSYELLIM